MYCITVTFVVNDAHAMEFEQAVRINARQSLADEPGCRVFDVCIDAGGTRFFLYELYDDADAFQAHLLTPHFAAFDRQVSAWVIDKSVQVWRKLPA
jgi:(4S)-4-hydroxy-5-phosphonooxypentane-2,3-dione isomerase